MLTLTKKIYSLAFILAVPFLIACSPAKNTLYQQPFIEKINLFEANMDGYAHYRVPAIIVSSKGTVLAFAEARQDLNHGDWGVQDIVMRRSSDGGRTWQPPRIIAHVEGEIQQNPAALAQGLGEVGEITYSNVVPIVDQKTGNLHFLFCVEYARCYYMLSQDDGNTFTKPTDITSTFEEFRSEYNWKVIATGPGHGIQLNNGRLLVPVWLSEGTAGHAHRPSIVSIIYSDDSGSTWERGDVVVRHPELVNPSETLSLELVDGRTMLNIRNESPGHRRAVTYSADGATQWSKPEFHPDLVEPICMGSLIRLSTKAQHGRNRIIFANPNSSEPKNPEVTALGGMSSRFKRQNLTARLSYDEGETWPVSRPIEPGVSGYSDLAVGSDGTIYLIYEREGVTEGSDSHIKYVTVAHFNLEWLTRSNDRWEP